ncbi:hypothetical protein SSS_04256 [Sarcoptes scabiei]|nr:hypothetical protein SSS_04256 [Sarcoptes scabiei]
MFGSIRLVIEADNMVSVSHHYRTLACMVCCSIFIIIIMIPFQSGTIMANPTTTTKSALNIATLISSKRISTTDRPILTTASMKITINDRDRTKEKNQNATNQNDGDSNSLNSNNGNNNSNEQLDIIHQTKLLSKEHRASFEQLETTTTLPFYGRLRSSKEEQPEYLTFLSNGSEHSDHQRQQQSTDQIRSDLYTIELTQSPRRAKLDDITITANYKCPKQHLIHPCECFELDKRAEMFEGSGDGFGDVGGGSLDENGVNLGFDGFGGISEDIVINGTPAFEMIEEVPVHPDLIETAVFCKNIRSVQVLTEAIRGFQGHRINYFVIDGCKLPPFPNNLFKGIHVIWMEVLNSTVQFNENFFHHSHQSKHQNCP